MCLFLPCENEQMQTVVNCYPDCSKKLVLCFCVFVERFGCPEGLRKVWEAARIQTLQDASNMLLNLSCFFFAFSACFRLCLYLFCLFIYAFDCISLHLRKQWVPNGNLGVLDGFLVFRGFNSTDSV